MRSGTSFFDLTIYRKTFTRFWPLWTVNLVIWLFILPFNGLMQMGDDPYGSSRSLEGFACTVGDMATEFGVIFTLLAGLVVAMAVCSHLYNNRSANFMGALPVRREGQFISTYLAGLTMLIGPNVVIFLLTLLVETVGGVVMWLPLLFWLAALCAMEFFFYSFAVCLGQFTGHILTLPVYYGVFNAIVVAVYGLLNWIMRAYYFGFSSYSFFDVGEGGRLVYWCTPVAALLDLDIDYYDTNLIQGVEEWVFDIEGLWIAGVYAIVAVVLTICALLIYRRRHLETAGDIVAVKIMRPVFKYGVAVCAGMFLGLFMYEVFGLSQLGLMFAVVIWGIVGYFVAQMLLDKTIRVFKKWKGAAAVTAAFLVLFAVIGSDLTGYETRVPAADQVESVYVNGLYSYPSDSGSVLSVTLTDLECIADVVALHEGIVKYGEEGEPYENENYTGMVSVRLDYTLKSGRVVTRRYHVHFGRELNALGQKIIDHDTVRYQTYELDEIEDWISQGGYLDAANVYRNGMGEFVDENADMLWNAVMADFEARRIGIHVLESNQEWHDKTYILGDGGLKSTCEIEFRWAMQIGEDEGPGNSTWPVDGKANLKYKYMQIVVLEQSVETRRVLEQLLPVEQEPEKTLEEIIAGI